MVVSCVIDFDDNPFGTYFAGQMLTGKVTLQSDKPKNVKAITLTINGLAHTSWSERRTIRHNGKTHSHTRRYSGHEDYIASVTYLIGSEVSNSAVIAPGIHTYSFACHIPINCPSSFEGLHGHVRYTVKVTLIRPWKFNQTFTKGFTVLKIMDLNYDSQLLGTPSSSEMQKTFCCWPCASKPLTLQVTLPQSGYVPGQLIPVTVLVTNDSNIAVQQLKVELVMLACYFSQSPSSSSKSQRIVVATLLGDPVLHHCKKLFTYNLPVPATPPTCFNLCRIIQIAYQVEVTAVVKGCHTNQMLCTPVTIGNVPLMNVINQQPLGQATMQRSLMHAPPTQHGKAESPTSTAEMSKSEAATPTESEAAGASAPLDSVNSGAGAIMPWAADATIPPPTYEQAVHMQQADITAGEEHDYGDSVFAPRYPVFHIPSPTAPPPNADELNWMPPVLNESVDPNKSTWL